MNKVRQRDCKARQNCSERKQRKEKIKDVREEECNYDDGDDDER